MPQATKPRRVPLLWILLPYATGIGIARFTPFPDPIFLLLLTGVGLGGAYYFHSSKPAIWHLLVFLSIVLLGAARFQTRHIESPVKSPIIPREAYLELEIKTLFNATDPNTALGIASVVKSPIHQRELSGLNIFFYLETLDSLHYPNEGEIFRTQGVIRPIPSYSNGDRFDAYLRNQGISYAYKQGYIVKKISTAKGLTSLTNRTKDYFAKALSKNKIPNSPLTGAYKGLMLGEKSELTPDQKQLFLANGTMHLFAISGLHIGVIAICIHQLLTLFRLKRNSRALATLAAVTFFVLVTGGSASSWRALLMVACFYLTSFGYKQASPLNALVLSALIYLLLLPGQLFQAGFQMSYFTVASILLLGLPLGKSLNAMLPLFPHIPGSIQNQFQKILTVSKKRILDSLGVSIAAFLMSAMLGIYYFQILPSYGIFINLFALPLASLAIVAGFLSLLLSPIATWIPINELLNNAALLLIKIIHSLLEFTSTLPLSSIETQPVPAYLVASALLSSLLALGYSYSQVDQRASLSYQIGTLAICTVWIFVLL